MSVASDHPGRAGFVVALRGHVVWLWKTRDVFVT